MTLKQQRGVFVVQAFELYTGLEIYSSTEVIELEPNATTEVFDIELPGPTTRKEEPVIMATSLRLDADDSRLGVIARCTNWPQPYRYLDMPTPDLTIRIKQDKILVKTNNVPVKGLAFYVEDIDSVDFEDNLIDLVPGDEQVVVAQGLKGKPVKFRYYGMHGSALGTSQT
jgi:beta-mannosidase